MSKPDTLFDLIHSLSGSEKRHFKIFASKHIIGDQNNYVKLFDVITKQKSYDQEVVLKAFKGTPMAKRLSSEKVHLYKLILKSLRVYYTGKTITFRLNEYLTDIQVLYDKRLFKQCFKLVAKAIDMARTYDRINYLPVLFEWNKSLIDTNPDLIIERAQSLHDEDRLNLDRLYNTNLLWDLYSRLRVEAASGGIDTRSNAEIERIKKLFSAVNVDENQLTTFKEKWLYYNAQGMYYHALNDFKQGYASCKKLIGIIENDPNYENEYTSDYIAALNNTMIFASQLNKHEECRTYINKIEELSLKMPNADSPVVAAKNFRRIYLNKIQLYVKAGWYKEGMTLVADADKLLSKHRKNILAFNLIIFNYNMAYITFVNGDYEMTIDFINRIINNNHIRFQSDIHSVVRILNLIAHFELGNIDLISNLIRTTDRFIKKQQRYYKIESALLNFMRKDVLSAVSDKELLTSIKTLKSHVARIIESPLEKKFLDYFDLMAWLESKISGKPLLSYMEKGNQT